MTVSANPPKRRTTLLAAADRSMPFSWPSRFLSPSGPTGLLGIVTVDDISCEFAFRSFSAKNSLEARNHSRSMRRDARRVALILWSIVCEVV